MKHNLITAIIMALCLVPITSFAQNDEQPYDFSAENEDGVTLYYKILSEEEKTCELTRTDNEAEYWMNLYGYKNKDIVIPSVANGYSVTSIGRGVFNFDWGLVTVTIPRSIKEIKEWAFTDTYYLKKVIIEDITAWCHIIFSNSESNPLQWSRHLFSDDDTEITDLIIPNTTQYVSEYAFLWFEGLKSLTIPKSVKSIGERSFRFCTNLESITIDEDNTFYDSRDNCNAIIETSSNKMMIGCKNTVIPNTVTMIGEYAFSSCKGLTSITIPISVKHIGDYAFRSCSDLTSITIPSSVTSIGREAFYYCTNLSAIYSGITDFFDIDKSVFQYCENATLYVPKGMVTTYRSSTGWSVIKNIEEMPDNTPDLPFLISCSGKGSVSINGLPSIIKKIATANINEGSDNTFTFTPNPGCKLDHVILNGLDITANVEGNTLTCTIPAKSQMIVTFTTEQGDINNDGRIDISDVVSIVNKILGN